ncbi:unnamed protein product [Hyaloperonospora brassicae]|uniref:RxLR effector candidate protein n=1 Tax=Hyaloperonospora brassicae TaxID=162125 RepID=A0AAV0U9Y2_HYABA|nr:unnamed protein product [Hyaloperonospora brassicae]
MRSRCLLLVAFGTLLASLPTDGKLAGSPARNATVTRIDEAEPIQDISPPQAPLNNARTVSSANSPSRLKDTVVDATSRTEINREERMEWTIAEKALAPIVNFIHALDLKLKQLGWDAETLARTKSFWDLATSKGTMDVNDFAQLVIQNARMHSSDSYVYDEEVIKVLLSMKSQQDVANLLVSLHGMKGFKDHAVRLLRVQVLQSFAFRTDMSKVWTELKLSPKEVFELLDLKSGKLPVSAQSLVVEWYKYVKVCQKDAKLFALDNKAAEDLLFQGWNVPDAERDEFMEKIAYFARVTRSPLVVYGEGIQAGSKRLKEEQAQLAQMAKTAKNEE